MDEEIKNNLGGDASKLYIGGFSQGAALAFYTAFQYPDNIGGVISLSGHCIYSDPTNQIQESKKSIPIFVYHGKLDFKIPYKASFTPWLALEEAGFTIEHHTDKKMGHTVSDEELSKLAEFMEKSMT
eukprot:CAMPEP_0205831256 /NCGR_PEP_ID=MMETSP0206-20130828/43561_1 /ASSEMBLY_ACC=CAM_ASM_000279 /TAXON_ID=36767 /ORGANISM="Euplotes focardii, Strain TN1" /LENGTH=126 /DNA_ID=CAMNT_0053135727 /DNA_START=318 /DNA_END=698 /DNA_ORIENTATION=+